MANASKIPRVPVRPDLTAAPGDVDANIKKKRAAIFHSLFDTAPDALLIFDADQHLLSANAAASPLLARLGLLGPGSLKFPLLLRNGESALPRERSPIEQALAGETVECGEYLVDQTGAGTPLWIECTARPVAEPGGAILGAAVSVRDITARGEARQPPSQGEPRIGAFIPFIQHCPCPLFIKDLNGNYVYRNDACGQLFDAGPEEFIGEVEETLWSPADAERYRESDATVIRTREPFEAVVPLRRADCVRSWLIHKFPVDGQGDGVLAGGIAVDITEHQMLEGQTTQSRKMEALGRLAGGVAHDFNNLLTVISGYGQLATEGIGTTSEERLTGYLQVILVSARRAADLTGQLLAFSRRQAIELKLLDLADLLGRRVPLLQRMIGEHIDLKVREGPEPCAILADRNQIEQVVMNLVANARDAMPLGGTLEIDCRRLDEPRTRPGLPSLGVVMRIRDTGIGMDEALKARIFEAFFTSKGKAKGTGLGLSTAYEIVTAAGGEIEVESALGEGSTFSVYFPLAEGEIEPVARESAGATPAGLETVLLVEDDDSVRLLAETVLSRLGYRVLVASSGKAALEIWEESGASIDVLLTDVIMPQMSGSELAHKLRDTKPDLKILFMSGFTDDMIASHGVLAGETQLLSKPFSADDLGLKLRSVLDAFGGA